ncbi:t1pks [Epichloe bromicola]|uniref:T1pks n=1 Tax=Epichloe bromicola TaxID=79588 RepID=A0ABQ0CNA2_9HYPO
MKTFQDPTGAIAAIAAIAESASCATLLILMTALRDGDNIRAVIRNSAVNQDGRMPGLTVPSAAAQTEAIKRAYGQVLMVPEADYVEAHGTGTKVGDPIEVNAIAAAFTQGKPGTQNATAWLSRAILGIRGLLLAWRA